jgi:hypothetical protein
MMSLTLQITITVHEQYYLIVSNIRIQRFQDCYYQLFLLIFIQLNGLGKLFGLVGNYRLPPILICYYSKIT